MQNFICAWFILNCFSGPGTQALTTLPYVFRYCIVLYMKWVRTINILHILHIVLWMYWDREWYYICRLWWVTIKWWILWSNNVESLQHALFRPICIIERQWVTLSGKLTWPLHAVPCQDAESTVLGAWYEHVEASGSKCLLLVFSGILVNYITAFTIICSLSMSNWSLYSPHRSLQPLFPPFPVSSS